LRAGRVVPAGEQSPRERAVDEHPETVGPALRQDLVLGVAADQRVVDLHRAERRTPERTLARHRTRDLPRAEVARAELPDESARDEVLERLHCLLERRRAIRAVQQIEIDVVDAELSQACLAGGD